MPTITINGKRCEFAPGHPPPMILQVANANGVEIPQYCYHDGLSIVASCRICLGEVFAVNPKSEKLEPFMGGKLLPTCQTPAADGMVVYTDSPKAVQNQKAVMEYLLISHPLDCPVCDQAGECLLQDYSYEYGRGVSRFEEAKIKQPKKDVGRHVLLYSDRCILCTRCVRFTREVTGTNELMVMGRGNMSEIDIFPGKALDNELSANVVDLCPVGALLDKDFLFAQRVWFLKSTPSIDGITASGDNIYIEHNEGKVYRIKPRVNLDVNKWWITDEVRYTWRFIHSDKRLRQPMRRRFGVLTPSEYTRVYDDALAGLRQVANAGRRLALVVSPMLPCEEAYALAKLAREIDPQVILSIGPVPRRGEDKSLPPNAPEEKAFRVYAEKCPNARGVRRVLEAITGGEADVLSFDHILPRLSSGEVGGVILTGNYPDEWADDRLLAAVDRTRAVEGDQRLFVVLIDTLRSRLVDEADVVIPGATWAEKSGTFENARNMLQAFEAAIPVIEFAKPEGQIAFEMIAVLHGVHSLVPFPETITTPETAMDIPQTVGVAPPIGAIFNPALVREEMARTFEDLSVFLTDVRMPEARVEREADMQMVEL